MPTQILVVSPDAHFVDRIAQLLHEYAPDAYDILRNTSLSLKQTAASAAVVDEEFIHRDPEIHLARLSFELYPTPFIYLVGQIQNERAFKSIRSLSTDYLLKEHISGAVLHNSLKYAIESTRLRLELEKQQTRYKSLFYNSLDPAFFLTSDWEIENVNTAFSTLFELDFNQCKGMSLRQFLNKPEEFDRLIEEKSFDDQSQMDAVLRFKVPEGDKKFLGHMKLSILREYDSEAERKITVGYHGTVSNVSYKERLRRINARAERVGMTYRLARALAHEIRNPLTNVNLALQQIRDEISIGEEGEIYLDIIERSAARIDRLIGQLLSSSHRKPVERQVCNASDIFTRVVNDAKDSAAFKNVEIVLDIDPNLPEFSCDLEKIKLAVTNLVTNAIEAIHHENGKVTLGAYLEDGDVCLYVEDNGDGMDEEVKERLFEPFYTAKPHGLGLGLTATQTIIAEHEGQIEIESSPGIGSTITISIPLGEMVAG